MNGQPDVTNLTLLGRLRRVLPDIPSERPRMLSMHARRSLQQGVRAVQASVEIYEPSIELDMARLKLTEAEMWIGRAAALKGDS